MTSRWVERQEASLADLLGRDARNRGLRPLGLRTAADRANPQVCGCSRGQSVASSATISCFARRVSPKSVGQRRLPALDARHCRDARCRTRARDGGSDAERPTAARHDTRKVEAAPEAVRSSRADLREGRPAGLRNRHRAGDGPATPLVVWPPRSGPMRDSMNSARTEARASSAAGREADRRHSRRRGPFASRNRKSALAFLGLADAHRSLASPSRSAPALRSARCDTARSCRWRLSAPGPSACLSPA